MIMRVRATVNLLTAVMGSGKTLYLVQLIDELLQPKRDEQGQLLPLPRIYTNITGLQRHRFAAPDNIELFATPELGIDTEPFDWRDCPEGSIVIYDEAQLFFGRDFGGGQSKRVPDILLELTLARHKGIELYFVTQDSSQLHHQIRNVVGQHLHLYRAFNARASKLYIWQHYCSNPNSRVEQARASSELWTYPERYYSYYKSADLHTRQFGLPKQLKRLMWLLLVVVMAWVVHVYRQGGLHMLGAGASSTRAESEPSEAIVTPAQTKAAHGLAGARSATPTMVAAPEPVDATADEVRPYAWTQAPAVEPVAGCVVSKRHRACHCYNANGRVLALEYAQCLSVVSQPLPYSMRIKGVTSESEP